MDYSKTLRLGEEKGYEASKFICFPGYFILVFRLCFSVSIDFELETCHRRWQKNKKQETVPTSLEVKAFA